MMLSQPPGGGEEDISVNFGNVSLCTTNWTIHGLNLFINTSQLHNARLFIAQNTSFQKYGTKIKIINSTFGHMNVRGGYNIQVSDCTVDVNTVTSNSTLLDVVGGTISVSNSSFSTWVRKGLVQLPVQGY